MYVVKGKKKDASCPTPRHTAKRNLVQHVSAVFAVYFEKIHVNQHLNLNKNKNVFVFIASSSVVPLWHLQYFTLLTVLSCALIKVRVHFFFLFKDRLYRFLVHKNSKCSMPGTHSGSTLIRKKCSLLMYANEVPAYLGMCVCVRVFMSEQMSCFTPLIQFNQNANSCFSFSCSSHFSLPVCCWGFSGWLTCCPDNCRPQAFSHSEQAVFQCSISAAPLCTPLRLLFPPFIMP